MSYRIILKDSFSHISIDLFGLYLSPDILLNFLSNLYILPWLGIVFKFMVFRLLKNSLASQKIQSRHFISCFTQAKVSPSFLSSPPSRQKKINHSMQGFLRICFPQKNVNDNYQNDANWWVNLMSGVEIDIQEKG